jgi:apolipoprotein D and lipocalin family protein
MNQEKHSLACLSIGAMLMIQGCSPMNTKPLKTVDHVELQRFMGDWYVIANIPTFLERDAHNAVESYRMLEDGRIATTFTFRKGGFSGPRKTFHPTGYVVDKRSNAVWGMQFLWPFKADYRIIYLDPDYSQTVIGRNKRDYVWIMARTPAISEQDWDALLKVISEQGYDVSRIQMVPQHWPDTRSPVTPTPQRSP